MLKKNTKQKSEDTEKISNRVFAVGDLAVYPAHGVGKIEAIETKVVNGEEHDFYIVKILENNMVIMIPTWNVESVGLRNIINEDTVPKIYNTITQEPDSFFDNQTWNRRYKDYMEKIKTGSLYDVASVFRDLYLLKSSKDLSFGERKLFDTATNLLLTELSIVKNTTEAIIMSELEALLKST